MEGKTAVILNLNLTHNKLVVRPHEKIAFVGPVLLIFEPWWEKCSFSQSEAAM